MSDAGPSILFQLTGSIACFKACDLASRLAKRGMAVQTVASAGALRFVGAATLEGITGRAPFTDLYEAGRAMDHI
ncbi:MAG: flavoprotein, partial [Burkholderiales bacterium]